jgi:MbtH protein
VSSDDQDRIQNYMVLVNEEEQYSLWPSRKSIPAGWRDVGVYGPKAKCLEYIEEVWKDITPLSVRKRLESARSG